VPVGVELEVHDRIKQGTESSSRNHHDGLDAAIAVVDVYAAEVSAALAVVDLALVAAAVEPEAAP